MAKIIVTISRSWAFDVENLTGLTLSQKINSAKILAKKEWSTCNKSINHCNVKVDIDDDGWS